MYLLYLDASGTASPRDSSNHYVLVGLCMREGTWFALDKRLQALKRQYRYAQMDFELHVKQFAVTIKEQDEIPDFEQLSYADRRSKVVEIRQRKLAAETTDKGRRKRRDRYKESDPFVHLTRAERSQLLEDAVAIVASHSGILLFAESIDKRHPQVVSGNVDPTRQAFEQVVSRFDNFLYRRDQWKLQKGPRRFVDHGLLVLDRDPSTESAIDAMFKTFRDHGHSFGKLRHVIDVPFFASSEKVSGLQLADVCAYVVKRYMSTGAKPGSHEEQQFQRLFPRFDRDIYGKLHGVRHYVAKGVCSCLICRDRGHDGGASAAGAPSGGS